jgi:hypothetical protein
LRHFRLLLFLIIRDVQKFEHYLFQTAITTVLLLFLIFTTLGVFKLTVFVGDDLDELGFTHDSHTFVLKHFLNLLLNFRIIEGIRVDDRDVLFDRNIFLLVHVTVDSWDSEQNVVRAHSTGN